MNHLYEKLIGMYGINGGTCWDRNDGSIYNPIGFSTIDFISTLTDIDIKNTNNDIVNQGLEKFVKYYDAKSSLFKYSDKSAKLPCITAKMLSILQRVRYPFIETETVYEYFLNSQQSDGGWRCATVKIGKSPETDASNPGTTLYILDAFRYRKNSKSDLLKLNRGVGFLLDHWVTRKPLGPCGFGIGTTFMKTEYPFYRYTIFYYVYVLSFYQSARNDKRFKEVFGVLKRNETPTGLKIEKPHKNWKPLLFNNSYECELSNRKYSEIKNNIENG
jgi:hypothetical protein